MVMSCELHAFSSFAAHDGILGSSMPPVQLDDVDVGGVLLASSTPQFSAVPGVGVGRRLGELRAAIQGGMVAASLRASTPLSSMVPT